MDEIWFLLILGHLTGDYLFQSRFMAGGKYQFNLWGWICALSHCFCYSCLVCVFLQIGGIDLSPKLFGIIFLSHFILDKFPLMKYWFKALGIRSWDTVLEERWVNGIPWSYPADLKDLPPVAFGAIVYAVADNTVHLILMYIGLKLFILPDYVEVVEILLEN